MPASAVRLSSYQAAVERLARAFRDLGPLAAAAEDQAIVQDTSLDQAIDGYVSESRQLFQETLESDPRAALASLGGDFRVLAELGTAAEGPELIAAEPGQPDLGDFTADMAFVVAVAGGQEPDKPQMALAAEADPVSGAVASINAISSLGQSKLMASAAAAILPNVGELSAVVAAVFGPQAAAEFATALNNLKSWTDRIFRSAVKLLQAATDKAASLLGSAATDQIKNQIRKWIENFLSPSLVYEDLLRVPPLRDKAKTVLATGPDAAGRATRIAGIADDHASDQRWIGWGAKALSWVGPKLHTMAPWGPPVVVAASIALVLVCVWLTEDHLDSYDVAWLPNRIPGVGSVLA
jgi:hypothetical protein